jgi:hypothetical protein
LFGSTTESALGANEALEEVQGKLLDFDKFRAMNSTSDTNMLGIDETLLNALAGFDSILGKANTGAKELAEKLKKISGLFNEDGTFNEDRWNSLKNAIVGVGVALAIFLPISFIGTLTSTMKKFGIEIFTVKNAIKLLNVAIVGGIVWSVLQAIDAFKQGKYWAGILYTAVGVTLVGAFILLNKNNSIDKFIK